MGPMRGKCTGEGEGGGSKGKVGEREKVREREREREKDKVDDFAERWMERMRKGVDVESSTEGSRGAEGRCKGKEGKGKGWWKRG